MITIKQLTADLVAEAGALLYQVYIEQQKWHFNPNNPSQLRVETYNKRHVLVDRFTKRAVWFGAFDDDQLVGCIRLCGVDENDQFEIEGYSSSQPILNYIPKEKKHSYFEITKLATRQDYVGRGIVKRLLLVLFQYCEDNQSSAFTCTHNGYLKSFYRKIQFPLKVEHAFKYELQDPLPVNFYFADYEKSEVVEIRKKLEYLENDLSNNAAKIFKALETVEPILPTPFYWMDKDGVVLGINELCLKAIGTTREIIGKKPYDFYKKEIAEHILKHNNEVIDRGEILSQEECIEDITTKEVKYFSAIKAPLYDDEGRVIGIIGSSTEITSQKEAEQLRIKNEQLEFENKAHKLIVEAQEKFHQIVSQVAHDIKAPSTSLLVLAQECIDIPEKHRIELRQIAQTISDLATNVLHRYEPAAGVGQLNIPRKHEALLISTLVQEILSVKRLEYSAHDIVLEEVFSKESHFAFVEGQQTEFKRMLSNLINNVIEACAHNAPRIRLSLKLSDNQVILGIADNGAGMPDAVIERIMNEQAVTAGKVDGHGIGLTQVRQTLKEYQGKMQIKSVPGQGALINLIFKQLATPAWIADRIEFVTGATVLILDDYPAIHTAWDQRLRDVIQEGGLTIQHFRVGREAMAYVDGLSPQEKENLFLLADYELLKQDVNGLDVLEHTGIKHSILVTSHYTNPVVLERAALLGAKVLPKLLVVEVSISIKKEAEKQIKIADLIIVDDRPELMQVVIDYALKDKKVSFYSDPYQFLQEYQVYPKEIPIFLDDDFGGASLNGRKLAEKLHQEGYHRLYLISGTDFKDLPEYLIQISRFDIGDTLNHPL